MTEPARERAIERLTRFLSAKRDETRQIRAGHDLTYADLRELLKAPSPQPDTDVVEELRVRADGLWELRISPRTTVALNASTPEIQRMRKAIGVFADALDVADNIIAVNCGTDTPKEWDRAFRQCAKARAALKQDEENHDD